MCGLAGFTMLRRRPEDPQGLIRRMTAPLTPRGPDDEGYYVDAQAALGHRRLSIIDLAGGHQPLSCDGGRYQIVFNGEIYNYIELRAELEKRGRRFATQSDTEVILHQYVLDGARAFERCNGMFALAIWDAQAQELVLARDRMGKKPLYYTISDGELVFASELKALLEHPAVGRRLSLPALNKYLAFGYVPAPDTIFEGIHKLEPGSWLRFGRSETRREAYWDLPLEDHPVSAHTVDQCAEALRTLLAEAVRQRLRSDVPVGVFLSGGIDSSVVTALAARQAAGRLHSFSIGFEEASYDESPYARRVAALCGTEHHHEVLSLQRACAMLPDVLRRLDEPLADASVLPTYLLSQFTRREVKVVLGGDGGDELFLGYPSFQAHRMMERLSFLPPGWRDALNRLARRLPVSHRYASVNFLVQQFFKGAGISPEIRFMLWMGCFGNDERRAVLAPAAREALGREDAFENVRRHVRQSRLDSDLQRIVYLCMKMYLQDDILVKVDRASMANSLEVRAPFLDYRLVEFACGMPLQYKLRGLTTKYILKYAFRDALPREIVHRRKAGFMIPVASWLERDLRGLLEETCGEAALRRDGLFDPAAVRRLIDEHMRHARDHRKELWALLCFQVWKRHYGGG